MSNTRELKRSVGVSLLELITVIAVIGMLAALLLPAVQSSREAARRISCQNNLRAIGIATTNFESAMHRFPPGYVGSYNSTMDDPNCTWIGALTYVLPFLEQKTAYSEIDSARNLNVDAVIRGNTSVIELGNWWSREDKCLDVSRNQFAIFACPSDDGVETTNGVLVAVHTWTDANSHVLMVGRKEIEFKNLGRVGVTNYVGSSGFGGGGLNLSTMRGVFYNRSKTKYRDILDGTSNTLLYGEVTGAWDEMQKPVRRSHSFAWMGSGAIPLLRGLDGRKQYDAFGSAHSAGLVSFVFVDGSVRSLAQGTSLHALVAFASMANGDMPE